ncbi:MAG: hypothetical protein WCA46_09380 [Actinocatenispora sp.]
MGASEWGPDREVSPHDRDAPSDNAPVDEPTGDDPEAPSEDRAEQARSVTDDVDSPAAVGFEVDEYDAVEQTRVVPHEEDEYR